MVDFALFTNLASDTIVKCVVVSGRHAVLAAVNEDLSRMSSTVLHTQLMTTHCISTQLCGSVVGVGGMFSSVNFSVRFVGECLVN